MSLVEEIYEQALCYIGCTDEGEQALLSGFSSSAYRELLAKLKVNLSPEDCREEFIMAGACLASSMYLMCRPEAAEMESFTAGDLSVKYSGAPASAAESYREMADIFMLGLVRDSGFDFRSVRG